MSAATRSNAEALRLLWRLKLRGGVRRQWRRMRTPKGAIVALAGFLMLAVWFGTLALSGASSEAMDPATLPQRVGLGALLLSTLSVSGALVHRGLFIPPDEIERLLAAPLSRSDLVRYRLRANALRNVFGGLLVGLMTCRRMPEPGFAMLGVMLGMQTLAVANQLLAIVLGAIENRAAQLLNRVGRVLVPLALAALLALMMSAFVGGDLRDAFESALGEIDSEASVFESRWLVLATRPFLPWARMIGAHDVEEFALWATCCVAILWGLVELTARLPIDFRELSLATSATIAARIRRARRGGGAASGRVSRRTVGWRIPHVFGHGPMGAVAWRKSSAILRKARGTVIVSVLVLGFVTVLASLAVGDETPSWAGSVLIGVLGTLYLCAGLRFDFRDELDRMDVIKAWPVSPGRLFLGMILPQATLVSGLLVVAIVLNAFLAGEPHLVSLWVAAVIPLVVFGWIALDNAVFLFAPIRFVPGQEGALQNAGRGVLLLLLRGVLVGGIVAVGFVAFSASHVLLDAFIVPRLEESGLGHLARDPDRLALATGLGALFVVVLAVDLGLALIGGRVLHRFDVSRDAR